MTQHDWQEEIAVALESEPEAIPDRAGDTPVLRLSRRLTQLDPTVPESVAACRAVVGAVRATEATDTRRWIDLCHIVRFSKTADPGIRQALLRRFLQSEPKDPEARTQVMTTLTDLGHRFAPEELRRESAIEQAYPAAWVSTWIRSGHFDLIKETISELVRAAALDVTSVLRLLPAWYQILGGRLVTAVPDWFGESALEDRIKVRRWFELRGDPLPQSFCAAKCPPCEHENKIGAKFCEECDASLARTCGKCGRQLSPTAKFCPECGHPTGVPVDPTPKPVISPESYTPTHLAERILSSKEALEGQRKQVTVLFADMKESTRRVVADRDPEEACKLLDLVRERMKHAVHHYEGTVNHVMGDGIMALFGAPLAHEDHAVRACYAAFDMRDSIRRWAEEARRSYGIPVEIRVGLNSGEVVVHAIDSDLHIAYKDVGQTVHLAHGMEQLATGGQILLTADTLRLAKGHIEVKPLGKVPVKGLEAPIEVYELTGARRPHTAARGLTRFVGREGELDQLHQALGLAARGHGKVVAIVGEAGVGKSRLVWEVTHSHRVHGWLVLQAGAFSYRKGTSYFPVIDLVKSYFAIEDRDDPRAVREKVTEKLLKLDRAQKASLPAFLSLLDVPTEESQRPTLDPTLLRRRTLDAVKGLLLRESRKQPLLVVVEDLHWIDSETQALLDVLVDGLPAARLLLLVNYRPEEYEHDWADRPYYMPLRLDPLPSETADELLGALLGPDPGLDALKRKLIERTEGNPFFLDESVWDLVETESLLGERGGYRLARPLSSIWFPPTVQAVLTARIDRLPPADKDILQMASVIGKDIPFAPLRVIAESAEDELSAAIGRLQDREFLYEVGGSSDLEYTFKHALTHDVSYKGLLQERYHSLHKRIVEAIEWLYSNRLPEHMERLAHHAFRGELWEKALTYLRRAGTKAVARSAHREAVRYFEQALTALRHLPETRETQKQELVVLFELRNSLYPLAELERIEGYLREAEALAETLGDQRGLGLVWAYRGSNHMMRGSPATDVRTSADRIEAIGERLGDDSLQIAAQYYLLMACHISGDYRGTERVCRDLMKRLQGYRTPERFDLAVFPDVLSRAFLARTLAERGEFDDGGAAGQEAIGFAERVNHPFSLIFARLILAYLHSVRGELSKAAGLIELAVAEGRDLNITLWTPMVKASLGHVSVWSGRVPEGVSRLEEALKAYESAGLGFLHSISVVQLGEGYLLADRVEDARDRGERALTLARQRGERGHEAWALRLLGEIASHPRRPDVATAETHYGAAKALASELGMRPLVAHCHLGLANLASSIGKREQAFEHLTIATDMYEDMKMRFWLEKAKA